jgi:hypothetical protein
LYLDCNIVYDEESFVREAYRRWQTELEKSEKVDSAGDLFDNLGRSGVIVLLDEVGDLVFNDRSQGWRFTKHLRHLSQSDRCKFVFTGEKELLEAFDDADGPYFNFTQNMEIGPLRYGEVEELATRPMAQMGIRFKDRDETVRLIYDYTSGHPNVVQRLCHRLVKQVDASQKREIEPVDVMAVVTSSEFRDEDFLTTFWERATSLERIISLIMCKRPTVLWTASSMRTHLKHELGVQSNPKEIRDAFHRLVALRSLVTLSYGSYKLAVETFPAIVSNVIEDHLEVLCYEYREHGDVLPR